MGAAAPLMLFPGAIMAGIPGESAAARDERMAWWREARFGMFIHWGLYSIPAGIWKGKKAVKSPSEWLMFAFSIPKDEYAKLAPQFNPTGFNAKEWVGMAKNAGMKYMVITSKHHDGFCMYDSKLTKYDIVDATPFKRDVIAELAAACAEEGIRFGLYYSQLDWRYSQWPYYLNYMPNFKKYMEYMKGQLKEILSNYGPICSLFFDGDWLPQWNDELGREVKAGVRSIQPNVIINNRLGKRSYGDQLKIATGKPHPLRPPTVGDYATPEQFIPTSLPNFDWETCMTMNDSWGFKSFDNNWKSKQTLIRNIIDIVSKGGNYLLNVGPTSKGLFPDASVERLADIGAWMKTNGESIYGTTAGPVQNAPWGRSTRKPGKIFLHVFEWPKDALVVSGISENVKNAYLLSDPARKPLSVSASGNNLAIKLPEKAPDEVASVIAIEF